MTLLQPTEVPSRTGINNAITSEIAAHASTSNVNSQHYDSGWVSVAPATGYEAYPGRPPKIRRVGKTVEFRGSFRLAGGGAIPGSSTNTLILANLPSGFAPDDFIGTTPMSGSAGTAGTCRGWVDSGGGVRGSAATSTPYLSFSLTWFV